MKIYGQQITACPLCYPQGQKRTRADLRSDARFSVSFAKARDELLHELELLGAIGVLISSNVPLCQDGLPKGTYTEPVDPGVAVYFKLKEKVFALACDKWNWVQDNMRAIGLHVAAIRGMQRWGVGELEQAFAGYEALPPSASKSKPKNEWWEVLGIAKSASGKEIKEAYLNLAKIHHPDNGGDNQKMIEINSAYEQATKYSVRKIKPRRSADNY